MPAKDSRPVLSATLLGFGALVFWSTVVAFIRSLVENLGPFSFLAITSGGGGLCLLVVEAVRRRSLSRPFQVKLKSLLWCGTPFVAYFVLFAVSLYLATSRELAVQLGLVNYLWPALMLLMSVPLAGKRARFSLLAPGMLLAVGGAVVGTVRLDSLAVLLANLSGNLHLFLMTLGATFCWALYSVLIGRKEHQGGSLAVPLFHLLTGIAALALAGITGEKPDFGSVSLPALVYVTVFPTAIGYLWWEVGLKRGNFTLLNVASYVLPISATLFACWYLGVELSLGLVLGSILVFLGAYLSWRAFLV